MRRKSLLFVVMLLACVMSASARTVKTALDLRSAQTEYDAVLDSDTKTLTALGELKWTFDEPMDISGYDRLVVKFTTHTKTEGWGGPALRLQNDGTGQNYAVNINEGELSLTLNLADVTVNNNDLGDSEAATLDKTAIKYIYLWGGGWKGTIVIDEICFEKDFTDYDKILSKETTVVANNFTVSDDNFNKDNAGDGNTVDAANNSFTIATSFGSVAWNFDDGLDISDCKSLVFAGTVKGNNVQLRLFDSEGHNCNLGDINHNDGEQLHTYDLTKELTYEEGSGTLDKTNIKQIVFWNYWGCNVGDEGDAVTITINSLCIEKLGKPLSYLVRENTAADAYKTICLPFAAAKPENATIYDVVGVDSKDNPSKLYLEAVETLEAGKAYVVKSDDDEDITFTKTGDDEDLTAPSTDGNMVGVFGETEYVPTGSYILSGGQWKKVVNENSNTVANYRAYLTLTDALVVTEETSGAKYAVMQIEGGTTGINTIEDAAMSDGAIYNLNGVRVQQPAKGLYIKNGKKYIVK